MPFAKKRKISETTDQSKDAQNEPATIVASAEDPGNAGITASTETPEEETLSDENEPSKSDNAEKDREERMERFRALQVRAVSKALKIKAYCRKNPTHASIMETYLANTE